MIFEQAAFNLFQLVRQETDSIGVAVSFGKDSLATLDLCTRRFHRVEGYYLYRVKGMKIVDNWAQKIKERYGVIIRMYPHFDLSRCYKYAVLQPHWNKLIKVPKIKMTDIEAAFRRDADVEWIAYGWRRNDSMSRAIILKNNRGFDDKAKRIYPLRTWRRQDVYAYLKSRNIQLPPGLGRKDQGGLDFHPDALAWLKEKSPEDYQKWLQDFPFSEMQLLVHQKKQADLSSKSA